MLALERPYRRRISQADAAPPELLILNSIAACLERVERKAA